MRNTLKDSGFIETADGWTGSAMTLAAYASGVGAGGRRVLKGSGTAGGAAETFEIRSPLGAELAVSGQLCEASVHVCGSGGVVSAAVVVLDGGGAVLATHTLLAEAAVPTAAPVGGLKSTFARLRLRFAAGAAGHVQLRVKIVSAGAGAQALWITRPLVDVSAPAGSTFRQHWDPGPSDNADLSLAAFPASLPGFLASGFAMAPTPLRTGFASESGHPVTARVNSTAAFQMRAQLRLTVAQRIALQDFFEGFNGAIAEQFWLEKAVTGELCMASWLPDGDPADAETSGPWLVTEIGLLLEPT